MIRALLVDDEPPARRKLRHMLQGETDVAIVAEAGSGAEAVEALERFQPDLAFLDVQLPDCTGFEVIESLESRDALHVIFVTAHDDFALKAFDVHALDYLLKPVEPSRFAQALNRARRLMETRSTSFLANRLDELVASLRPANHYVRRLLIQENDRSLFIEVDRIDWIESARNYACIHSGTRTYITRSSLDALAAKLDPTVFRRINRSEIVNVNSITEVRSWFHGDQKVLLKDGTELSWSRRYRSGSLEELERA
jgi:two-component system, LytTR family, response regulator